MRTSDSASRPRPPRLTELCDWSGCTNEALNTWAVAGVVIHLCDTHDDQLYRFAQLRTAAPVSSISVIKETGRK